MRQESRGFFICTSCSRLHLSFPRAVCTLEGFARDAPCCLSDSNPRPPVICPRSSAAEVGELKRGFATDLMSFKNNALRAGTGLRSSVRASRAGVSSLVPSHVPLEPLPLFSAPSLTSNMSHLTPPWHIPTQVSGIRAVVFGSTGFLGRYVVNKLTQSGTQCVLPHRKEHWETQHLMQMGDIGQVNIPANAPGWGPRAMRS